MRCPGCGAKLQYDDPKRPGFIPKNVFERRLAEGGEILCQRCYRIKHYGEYGEVELDIDFLGDLKNVLGSFEVVLWVLDSTDFEGTFREEIAELLEGKRVIYALTKIDMLPKALKMNEFKEWLKRRLKVPSGDIRLVSPVRGFGLNSLKRRLISTGCDKALVIGVTNSGKSTLVSSLAESETVSSPFPMTTLGILRRKMRGSGFHLYDTPGIVTSDRAVDLLKPECQKLVFESKWISGKTFKPKKDRAILLGGLSILSIRVSETNPVFQIFVYSNVRIHETDPNRAWRLVVERSGDFLKPPCDPGETEDLDWKSEEYEVHEDEELVIMGLGWVNVKRGPLKIEVTVPEGVGVLKRERLMIPKR